MLIRTAHCFVWILSVVPASFAQENLLLPLAAKEWSEDHVVHLLRRAAFEGTPAEIEKLSSLSLEQAVDYLIEGQKLDEPEFKIELDPQLSDPPPRSSLKELSESERQLYHQARRGADELQMGRIRGWWMDRMVRSPRQLQEKMVLFWHGHFTSGFREVKGSYLLYEQNQLFRKHALGHYRDLLLEVSTNPAMLLYLDSARNTKEHPNENYARELMELFTLGEGHYTEQDVKEAARAFTGFSLDDDGVFKFRRGQHDYDPKVFLGQAGDWNGGDIVDIILQQEQSHRFIVSKLWKYFCLGDPPKSVVDGLSATFRKSKFEIKPVVKQILLSRGFYAKSSRGIGIKSPVQLTIGALRQLGVQDYDTLAMGRAMALMGQELFQPPNVKGWDGGEKWINTATFFNRYNFAGGVIHGYEGRQQAGMMMKVMNGVDRFGFMEPPAREQVGQDPYDPSPVLIRHRLSTSEQIVDFYVRRMLAVELSTEHHQSLIDYIQAGQEKVDVAQDRTLDRIRTMIHLLMSTPEYQLY